MHSAAGANSSPQLDPQALQSTPVSFSRPMTPPGAPRLPRSDDDPPLLLDEDPPTQMHTVTSFFDLSHQIQSMQDPEPQLPYLQLHNQAPGPAYPAPPQFHTQPDQQVLYESAPQEAFFQPINPSSFYQQPPVPYQSVYQPPYNSFYPQTFNNGVDIYSLSVEKPEVIVPPLWDRPTKQNQILPPYQFAPLNSSEFCLHISSQLEEIRQHNALECSLGSIQAHIYEFPPLTSTSPDTSEYDDITLDASQQMPAFTKSESYCLQESQMKLETQLAKIQHDREDQEKMLIEKKRLKAEQREQRRLHRRADRQRRKQAYLEHIQRKHEKNLKEFARKFSAPPSAARAQSSSNDEPTCTISIDRSIKIYNSETWPEKPQRFRNLVMGNGYGHLFWPGYIDLDEEHGTSTVKIGLFGLELDGFLNDKDIFLATQTEIPELQEQNAYINEIEKAVGSVPGMRLWGCDPNNGVLYTFRSQRSK